DRPSSAGPPCAAVPTSKLRRGQAGWGIHTRVETPSTRDRPTSIHLAGAVIVSGLLTALAWPVPAVAPRRREQVRPRVPHPPRATSRSRDRERSPPAPTAVVGPDLRRPTVL